MSGRTNDTCYNTVYSRKWRAENPTRNMLNWARHRAKKKGIEFDITIDDIHIPEFCPIFGVVLQVGDPNWAPSLDRIHSTRGYVRGNVIVISNKANRIKNNGTPAEHIAIAKFYERLES